MSQPLPCYLRSYRLRAGLSQREVACLLGHERPSNLSRLEQTARIPSLEAALILERVFDVRFADLFPAHAARVDALLAERVDMLLDGRMKTPLGRQYLHALRRRSQP